MSLVFFDFEVFKHNWLVVFIDPVNREQTIICDDPDKLMEFYNLHKNDIWVGYNSAAYDRYIAQSILCGFDPYKMNEWIITKGKQGWQFSNLLNQYPINTYDVMQGINGRHSLKRLEAYMGNDIRESSVPFNIDRPLTSDEIAETIKYCAHDVEQTAEVFIHTIENFQSQMNLIKTFYLPLSNISKSQTQLAALILGAYRRSYNDEFNISIPDTLILDKYTEVLDFFFMASNNTTTEMMEAGADYNDPEAFAKWFYSRRLEIDVAGVPHIFAWGGVHGAPKDPYVDLKGGRYIMADVASLYPSLMIRYGYFSRSMSDSNRYVEIYNTNLEMKKNKDPRRPAYKLICNKVYGALKDVYNPLYDPLQANNICVAGQLLLLDLIEKLEPVCKLIQSNTDGILIKIEEDIHGDTDAHYEVVQAIVHAWEKRTGLVMEFSEFEKVIQGDVNNYIIIDKNGNYKSKGAYVKDLTHIDYDLPIVNQAITDYITRGIHPEVTILNCNKLKEFQKIVRVSSKYSYAMHNGLRLPEKTFRVFASKRLEDGEILKVKHEGAKPAKFGNVPESCFINNGKVDDLSCPDYLDKDYYVAVARKRLKEKFGLVV